MTRILANTLQCSFLESPSLTEDWQATGHGVAKSWTRPKGPCVPRRRTSFACGSSAPVRVEREAGTAAWLVGTLVAPSVQGHGLPPPRGLWPYQSLFSEPLVAGDQMAFFASFSVAPSIQALRGLPCPGSFSVDRCIRHLKGLPGGGSALWFSASAFDGPACLLFSCRRWRVGRERLW